MDVLLVNSGTEQESLATALQRLAKFIDRAGQAGAQDAAAYAEQLITSVNTTQSNAGAKDAITTLLEGLKELEGNLAQATAPSGDKAPAKPAAELSLANDPELLQDFVVEAREHLGVMETQLLALEQNPNDPEPTHACFRAIHTIKGVAGFLELNTVREVAHEGETLLDEVRNNRLNVVPALIDVLLQTADFLEGEVNGIAASLAGNPAQASASPVALLERLRRRDYSATETSTPKTPEVPMVEGNTVEVEPVEVPAPEIQVKLTAGEATKPQAASSVAPQSPVAPQAPAAPAGPVVAAAASRQGTRFERAHCED